MSIPFTSDYGVVVIGKNEGERLKSCLLSIPKSVPVVYVDSGSSDGSQAWVGSIGIEVLSLDMAQPFTAARARNAGFVRLRQVSSAEFVQFVDGDCELAADWANSAISFLRQDSSIWAVFGRRRERHPNRSIYNYLCDLEWDVPVGESRSFGGDVMIRSSAIEAVGGYRADLIAGEEPELCVRLRALGARFWRLDKEMTLHDAAIYRFPQWWKRTVRSGYAFAEGASIHGGAPERHWVWETRRATIWGALLPATCLILTIVYFPWGALGWLIYPLQLTRRMTKISGSIRRRSSLALFELLARFAEAFGRIKFITDRLLRRSRGAIDYK